MHLPSSGQVTLPAAFVEKILSSRRSNGSLKRSQTDRSGDASVIGSDEPSLQPRAKRQKQASPMHEELDTFRSPDPSSPPLLDLPNELLQFILANLTDSDLLSLALLFNRRLRANAARTYLARADIIGNNNGYIYIKDIVERTAIVLLSTTPLFDEISLICDLFYVVEYGRHLRKLIAATPRVRSVCIEFDERETELLHDTRIVEPLIAFLASLRDTCFSLQLQRSRSYFNPPTRSLTIPFHRPPRPVRQLPTRGLLKGISSLAVSADLTRIPSLFGLCRSIFVIASQVEDFQLEDCSSQQDCDSILSLINFPKLRTFSIRSLTHVTISIKVAFFKQHSLVKTVFLFSNPLNGLIPTAPKSALSLPPLTHLFLSANYRLLKLQDASLLQECFLQAPNIRPRPSQVEFCSNVNTLLAVLVPLTKYRFNNLKLVISLPNRIPDHVEQFLIYPEVQCVCRKPDAVRLFGVKTLEFMVDSFDQTMANRIADWSQICPDVSELRVKPQFLSELESQAIIERSQFNDFITTCKALLPNLSTIHCPAGVWKGTPRF